MITNIRIDGPYRALGFAQLGQELRIRAWSDATKLRVKIRCFVRPPEPPAFKNCAECGEFGVQNGEEISFQVSEQTFGRRKGFLNIEVTDSTGHVIAETVPVGES